LIVWKISKIVANRYKILRLKYTKIDFGWGSVHTQRSQDTVAAVKKPTSQERGKKKEKRGEKRGRRG